MPIHILASEVASQIAAGEVVERPASVVKELLENSLDAGASYVSIKVEAAGQRLIEVADDGIGISLEDLKLVALRHATSKLHDAADLFRIQTLGFRGEALASIGSVSRMTVTSKSRESDMGGQIRVDGGKIEPVKPVGVPQGTLVRVEDLFFNVPARLKFLKTDTTERRQIDELVTRYALAYPKVRFQLIQDKRRSLHTSGSGNQREVLASLYGLEIAQQMQEVLATYDELQVKGFISPISLTRSNRRGIIFFVNGRWVQDTALTTAIVQAYHTLLMVGRYPIAIIFLKFPPEMVDVNVHPAKSEVRFREKDRIFSGIQRAVRRALLAHTPVPGLSPTLASLEQPWDQSMAGKRGVDWMSSIGGDTETPDIDYHADFQQDLESRRVPLLRLIGQIASTYLVAEGPDGLYLIDQHAAHERVLFERFIEQMGEQIPSQQLLEPEAVQLPPADVSLLLKQLPILDRLGFQVEPFGPNTFLVRAIPALLTGLTPSAALRVLVEDFEEDETPLQEEVEVKIIARVCKRAAIKAGEKVSPAEQAALLTDLEACKSPRTCPHGRPTMIHLSVDLLERQFGRRGS
ncbi:MAG: DNA mismatch repair endonuclease MutL [Anaerolineales bacterium]|nr:DNA mismatch repair endonuclease MutL [Anaerolineales bacterium]